MKTIEKTGNRKCWHVVDSKGTPLYGGLTLREAKADVAKARQESSEPYDYCRDGYRLVPCGGEAHKPEVGGMIDNCGVCAPRWGVVMVPIAQPAGAEDAAP